VRSMNPDLKPTWPDQQCLFFLTPVIVVYICSYPLLKRISSDCRIPQRHPQIQTRHRSPHLIHRSIELPICEKYCTFMHRNIHIWVTDSKFVSNWNYRWTLEVSQRSLLTILQITV
jgi:hypothetical protein